jgi:hypothetical protein
VAAGTLGRAAGAELPIELGNPVQAAHVKMPPAAVKGHFQVGIGSTRDLGHIGSHFRELLRMIDKVV